MKFENDDDLERLNARFARHARDFDDLQNELAGRNVGRAERFLPGGANSADQSGKAKQERAEALTRLQLLLNNPAYAALYRETAGVLTNAQSRLEQMLERVQSEIEHVEEALEDKRGRAARIEDGTRVYRDKDGAVRTDAGRIIEDALAAGIIWNGNEPSFKDVQADIARQERLKALEDDIRTGQAEIGDMQASMEDEEDPRTQGEMEGFKDRTEEIVADIEERLDQIAPSAAAPNGGAPATELEIPKI